MHVCILIYTKQNESRADLAHKTELRGQTGNDKDVDVTAIITKSVKHKTGREKRIGGYGISVTR